MYRLKNATPKFFTNLSHKNFRTLEDICSITNNTDKPINVSVFLTGSDTSGKFQAWLNADIPAHGSKIFATSELDKAYLSAEVRDLNLDRIQVKFDSYFINHKIKEDAFGTAYETAQTEPVSLSGASSSFLLNTGERCSIAIRKIESATPQQSL